MRNPPERWATPAKAFFSKPLVPGRVPARDASHGSMDAWFAARDFGDLTHEERWDVVGRWAEYRIRGLRVPADDVIEPTGRSKWKILWGGSGYGEARTTGREIFARRHVTCSYCAEEYEEYKTYREETYNDLRNPENEPIQVAFDIRLTYHFKRRFNVNYLVFYKPGTTEAQNACHRLYEILSHYNRDNPFRPLMGGVYQGPNKDGKVPKNPAGPVPEDFIF